MDSACFIVKSCRSISYWMEQVCTCPVEYWHEVVTDNLNSKFGKIFDCLDIVSDVTISCRKTYFDVIVNVYRFNNVHVKSVWFELFLNFCDFFNFPNFTRHFVMQRPNNACNARNLFDIGKADLIISFSVPTKTHLHWHNFFPLNIYIVL